MYYLGRVLTGFAQEVITSRRQPILWGCSLGVRFSVIAFGVAIVPRDFPIIVSLTSGSFLVIGKSPKQQGICDNESRKWYANELTRLKFGFLFGGAATVA